MHAHAEQVENRCSKARGTGDVLRSPEERTQAPDRSKQTPKAIVAAARHKVQTDETLDGLARGVSLKWQQLTKFNFGTDDPAKVNKHLHDDLGCTRKAADKKNYVFNDDDDPGIVILPRKWSQRLGASQHHVIRVKPIAPPKREFTFSM